MVLLQCMVVVGVWIGTFRPACSSSDQCHHAGTFCPVGKRDRCGFCGNEINGEINLLPPQVDPVATGGTLNDPFAADFAGFNLAAVAELCVDLSLYTSDWRSIASVVSWCKSSNTFLCFLFPDRSWYLIDDNHRRDLRSPDRWHGGPADLRWSHRRQRRRDEPPRLVWGNSALRQLCRRIGRQGALIVCAHFSLQNHFSLLTCFVRG
jgi:hypothetical protein